MRVHRLISILVMIEKEDKIKAGLLAKALEVSTRTIYRDIEALSEAGFPLYATTGPEGGISFVEGYKLGLNREVLGKKDLLSNILTSIATIPNDAVSAQAIESGFIQLNLLDKTDEANSHSMSQRILIDNDTWWGEAEDPFDIKKLMDVLWQLRQIEISYIKSVDQGSIRTVDPYGLVLKNTDWYLIAYCHKAKSVRTFRCDKIAEIRGNGKVYELPKDFDLKLYWSKSIEAFTKSLKGTTECLVTFEMPIAYMDVLPDIHVVWNDKKKDWIRGTASFKTEELAKIGMVPLAAYAKVLKPKSVMDYVYDTLQEQLKHYEDD